MEYYTATFSEFIIWCLLRLKKLLLLPDYLCVGESVVVQYEYDAKYYASSSGNPALSHVLAFVGTVREIRGMMNLFWYYLKIEPKQQPCKVPTLPPVSSDIRPNIWNETSNAVLKEAEGMARRICRVPCNYTSASSFCGEGLHIDAVPLWSTDQERTSPVLDPGQKF